MRLEERFIQHPALAIEQSRITINSMAAEAQENLAEARCALLHHYSDEGYRTVVEMEQRRRPLRRPPRHATLSS